MAAHLRIAASSVGRKSTDEPPSAEAPSRVATSSRREEPTARKAASLHPPGEPAEWGDQELVAALLRGDARGAAVLYERLRPAIDHAVRRVLHHRHRDFEDLTQATFERVLRALADDRFEGRSSLKTWASAIAGHVALDALRASIREERRLAPLPEDAEVPARGRTDARLEALAELRRLHGILARMKPDLAETLVLYDVLGHSLKDISELRGATMSATQSRLHRGRIELRRRAASSIGRKEA